MINNIRRLIKIPLLVHFFSWMLPSILELLSKSVVMAVVIATLPKEDFGLVSIAMLVFSYSVLLQFGASDALRLHLPTLYAKNNLDVMSNQLNIAVTFSVQNIILASLLSLTFLSASDQSHRLLLTLTAYFISALFYQLYNHYLSANRYLYNFKITALARVLVSIFRLVLQISAVVFYGLEGFLLLEAFIYCLSIILMHFFGNLRLRSQWDYRILKSLLVTGFPLMLMSLIGMLANTLDRWFVLESSGIEGMATYSVAIYIGTLIMILPNQALSIVSQYTREMLAHGYNVELMKSLYWVIMKVFTVTWGVVCIVVLIAGYFIIYKYLPQYHDALQLLPLIIILSLLRSDVGIFGNYHIITGNQRLVLNSNVLAVITIIILNLLLILSLDYGLAGILSVSLLAALMQLLYLILMRSDHDINKHRRTIYVLSLCFFYVITYFLIFESLDNEIVDYMKFFAGFISLLLVSGVLLVAMYRKGEFEEIIRMAHRRNLSSNIES